MPIEMLYAAQKGDAEAQDRLMRDLYAPIFHFLVKRTGSSEEASELCQTVFLKCYQGLESYREDAGSVHAWVFRIARNTLFDHYRKHRSESLEKPEEVPAQDRSSNTQDRAEQRLTNEYVSELLAQLSPEDADVVTFRAIDEMPYEEIASIMGKSEEATRKMYSRALAALKQLVLTREDAYRIQ